MKYDYSFDKEKVQKECKKLIRVSNLGSKSLKGYIKRHDISSSEFSIAEYMLLSEIVDMLVSASYEWESDVNKKGEELNFIKRQLAGLFDGEDVPSDSLNRFIDYKWTEIKECYDFVTDEHNPFIPILKALVAMCVDNGIVDWY